LIVPAVVGDTYEHSAYFPTSPYHDDEYPGYMMIDPALHEDHWIYGGHFQGEYGETFDSISRIGGRRLLDSTSRWGVDTEFNYRREEIAAQVHDQLWTGDANLTFRFAQSRRVAMRTGIGMNWLSDRWGTNYGVNFTYGGEWFPVDPVVVTAGIDWGRIGDAEAFHLRTEVGLVLGRVEPFIGFDHFSVGGANTQELVSGIRIWF